MLPLLELVGVSLVMTVALAFEVTVSTTELDIGVDLEIRDVVPGPTGVMHALLPSYAVRPGDDTGQRLRELTAHAASLGFDLPVDGLVAQVDAMRIGHAVDIPAAYQPATYPASAVPFAFQLLGPDDAPHRESAIGELVEHVRRAVVNARSGLSRLLAGEGGVLRLQGMSDDSIRHLLNNLCNAPGTRYLEVGSWRGSTLASCLSGNEVRVDRAVAVDSWEDWYTDGEGRSHLLSSGGESFARCRKALRLHTEHLRPGQARLLRKDFRQLRDEDWQQEDDDAAVDVAAGASALSVSDAAIAAMPPLAPVQPLLKSPPTFNMYLFDGPHDYADHFDALALMLPRLAPTFVLLVDDWNGPEVQRGTFDALAALSLQVVFSEVLGGGKPPGVYGLWHNGFFVAVVRKAPAPSAS